jgi:hypothetical protein
MVIEVIATKVPNAIASVSCFTFHLPDARVNLLRIVTLIH